METVDGASLRSFVPDGFKHGTIRHDQQGTVGKLDNEGNRSTS